MIRYCSTSWWCGWLVAIIWVITALIFAMEDAKTSPVIPEPPPMKGYLCTPLSFDFNTQAYYWICIPENSEDTVKKNFPKFKHKEDWEA